MAKTLAILGALTLFVSLFLPAAVVHGVWEGGGSSAADADEGEGGDRVVAPHEFEFPLPGWGCALSVASHVVEAESFTGMILLLWLNTTNAAALASPWLLRRSRHRAWGLAYVNAWISALWWIPNWDAPLLVGYWTWLTGTGLLSFAFVVGPSESIRPS